MSDRTKVKICGIRDSEAAIAAADAGADFIGLNFVDGVKRQITLDEAKKILTEYRSIPAGPDGPKIVGLFRNQPIEFVNEVVAEFGLDYVQLNGDEDDNYDAQMTVPIFHQVRVQAGFSPESVSDLVNGHVEKSRGVVLDAFDPSTPGGSGKTFEWSLAEQVASEEGVLIAGGLNPENVVKAVQQLTPWGVDVASGVESDGVKDPELIRQFVRAAKNA
jgi:phosphoribosylanthranilate isomerase